MNKVLKVVSNKNDDEVNDEKENDKTTVKNTVDSGDKVRTNKKAQRRGKCKFEDKGHCKENKTKRSQKLTPRQPKGNKIRGFKVKTSTQKLKSQYVSSAKQSKN